MRRAPRTLAWIALPALAAHAGCGRDAPRRERDRRCVSFADCPPGMDCIDGRCRAPARPDAGAAVPPTPLGFGEPCAEDEDCESGICLAHGDRAYCTRQCGGGTCPGGWACKAFPERTTAGLGAALCALSRPRPCQACRDAYDCGPSGADACATLDGGGRCAIDCAFETCPEGYACRDGQCLPDNGTCECREAGRVRACAVANDHGACLGRQVCDPDAGFSPCDAPVPAAEDCNGRDDDCDGAVDEELPSEPCERAGPAGRCRGTTRCQGGTWRCDAPAPAAETCNHADDDCDGDVDEGFVEPLTGLYLREDHCGACGASCRGLIPSATAAECRLVDGAPACRATACEPGTFVYLDGVACLRLPETLCAPCDSDDDCVAPGSACIGRGVERYCGRSCAAGSPYGTSCPAGYSCAPTASGPQCVPQSGTCRCNAGALGSIRSCTQDTCEGFQACELSGGVYRWSACSFGAAAEDCDGLDDDCDGLIDEGFLDPATGRYLGDEHCGACHNDCTAYWVPQVHHAGGVCDGSVAPPACVLGPCVTERLGGVDYEYLDVNGDAGDGCECRRRLGNTRADPPDLFDAFPEPGAVYLDENCDGTDGVVADSMFVSASAAPGGDGTRDRPYRTIAQALAVWPASGGSAILVAAGVYAENVVVPAGAALYGGYAADFRARDVRLHASEIRGQAAPGGGPAAAVRVQDVPAGEPAVVAGFRIRGPDLAAAPPGGSGAASHALLLGDAPGARVANNEILGGRGGDGGRGATGATGAGRQTSPAPDGAPGADGSRAIGACPAGFARAGGAGGANAACGGTGRAGGGAVCPTFDWTATPVRGGQQASTTGAGGDGLGGHDWSFDAMSGAFCNHATESGFPSDIDDHNGQDGAHGADGAAGAGASGCAWPYGTVIAGAWAPVPAAAAAGSAGGRGAPGGGGGAGACGGAGGGAGGAGGASIAVFVAASSAALPDLRGNRVVRGAGGAGGGGGAGGDGGIGGRGGAGGGNLLWSQSAGGRGGDGGNGGPGGGAGGGCGGASYGILVFGADGAAYAAGNAFALPDATGTGGGGGAGGASAAAAARGVPGAGGASANLLSLLVCPAPGCPAGRVCDPAGICVPE